MTRTTPFAGKATVEVGGETLNLVYTNRAVADLEQRAGKRIHELLPSSDDERALWGYNEIFAALGAGLRLPATVVFARFGDLPMIELVALQPPILGALAVVLAGPHPSEEQLEALRPFAAFGVRHPADTPKPTEG
jgi:hypothetical protein